jgi:hypothetical protein
VPQQARSDDKVPISGVTAADAARCAKAVAKRLSDVIALADLLDELTKTKGELILKSSGRPVAERAFFGVEFLVPNVEFEDSVTNTVFGKEIPGRRVAIKICVDCDVECRVEVGSIKLVRHDDYEDTAWIVVPKPELIGRVPEGREFTYEVDYGRLRAKWLDSDEARAVRKEMLTKAARKAADDFSKNDLMIEFRKGLKRELRTFMKASVPQGRRIEIKFGDE